MDKLAEKIRNGEWTERDVEEFLEFHGYRDDTIARFMRGVRLRLKSKLDEGEYPTDEKGNHIRKKMKKPIPQPTSEKVAATTQP